MLRWFCIVVHFLISQFCFSEELTREQLIQGVNMSREQIRSGEMRLIVTRHYAPEKSPAEIHAWLEVRKEEILREYSGKNQEADKQQHELDVLTIDALRYAGWKEIEETNIAFRILDRRFVSYPKAYQYKMTMIALGDIVSNAEYGHYFQILTYDGQTQAFEWVNEHPSPSVSFFKGNKYRGFSHFQMYGRSLKQVPSNAKLVGREAIAGTDCYVLEYNRTASRNPVRMWVDAQKQFCIHKREYRSPKAERQIDKKRPLVLWQEVYENFQQYGDIWFPSVIRWGWKQDGKVEPVFTVVVKAAQFNLDFPIDFFQVNPKSYLERGLVPKMDSEISLGSLGGTFLKQPPAPNESATPDSSQPEPDPLLLTCGPNSLLRVCELLRVTASFDELTQLSRFDPNHGTTLLGLRDAAKYKGLNPKGIKTNLKSLKKNKLPMPAIVYVKGNHFLVFEEVVSDGVLISDSADKYDHHLTFKELSKIWNGELLIFDYRSEQIKQELIPLALAEVGFYNFGKALGGEEVRHTFKLKNIGQKPLKITKVDESCACTATLISKDEIPPGAFGIIEAVLKVPSENRQVEESINVYTNDPTQNRVTLILKGTAYVPITTFPPRLLIGSVQPKASVTKSLTIHRKGNTQILGVRTDSNHLRTTVISAKADPIMRIEVALLESAPVGQFVQNVLVDYRYEGKRTTHKVMVFGEILGAFTVSPNQFFFGLVKDRQSVSNTVEISSVDKHPFNIVSVESNLAYVTTKITPRSNGIGYKLTAIVQSEAPAGPLSSEILVKTDSTVQPTIQIPFSGIISH